MECRGTVMCKNTIYIIILITYNVNIHFNDLEVYEEFRNDIYDLYNVQSLHLTFIKLHYSPMCLTNILPVQQPVYFVNRW